jgi:hypothetical protein
LGTQARRFQDEARSKPQCGAKDLSRFAADLAATFNVRLRRLYGGQSFVSLGSLLLVHATAALTGQTAAIQATLSITAGNLKQTLVNIRGTGIPACVSPAFPPADPSPDVPASLRQEAKDT